MLIRATPERIWNAVTDGVETERYYYGTRVDSDWSKGGRIVYAYPDGSIGRRRRVLDIDPGRSVTMTFHPRWSPEIEAEGPVRMTWAIEPAGPELSEADGDDLRDGRGGAIRRSSGAESCTSSPA